MAIVGKLLRGHFKVINTLGSGGVGETYIAVDIDRPGHPQCVVKRLKPSTDAIHLPVIRTLFRREAETLEKLGHHDQIPRLLAYFEENEEFFLVQDFIEGQTLNVELPAGHRWVETKVIQLLQDVLTVLEFVHSQDVIHRDIKPANLIRRFTDRRLILIDFGAVKQVRQDSQASPQTGIINPTAISIGTEGYMPPEQLRGTPYKSSDIYALGMIGIQALTGAEPIQLQLDGNGEVIWRHKAQVSDGLASILSRMVCYYFKDRYQSAIEVLQALQVLTLYSSPSQSTTNNETQLSFNPDDQSLQTVEKAELRETRVALNSEPPAIPTDTTTVESQSTLNETKVSLNPNNQSLQPIASAELRETKVVLGNEPSVKTDATDNLHETKVSLGAMPSNSAPVGTDLKETKVVLISHQVSPVPKANLQETKVSLDAASFPSDVQSKLGETKMSLDAINPLVSLSNSLPETNTRLPRRQSLFFVGLGVATIGVVVAIASWFALKPFNGGGNYTPQPSEAVTPSSGTSSSESVSLSENTPTQENNETDYSKLEAALQQQNWEAADEETYQIMLKIAGSTSESQGMFDPTEWNDFPCEELRKIDQLWSRASENRLGFSAQRLILNEVGKDNYYDEIGWRPLGKDWLVRWTYNEQIKQVEYLQNKSPNFESPPAGHLPAKLEWEDGKDHRFERISSCGL
jgi:serine/threonine protein kinase